MAIKLTPYLLISFLFGVGARSFFDVSNWLIFGLIGLITGFLIVVKVVARLWNFQYISVCLILLFFLLGILRFSFFENTISSDKLHEHYGETLTLQGAVSAFAEKTNSAQVTLKTDSGKILIISGLYPQYKYGDVIEVYGKILEPQNFQGFDYKKYLAKSSIYSEMSYPKIIKKGYETKNKINYYLYALRDKFEENLKNILPAPHSSLADGILLGNQASISTDLLDAFRKTGTIHMLVLSGYNITVVGVFFMAILGFLPETITLIGSVVGIIAFTIMAGAAPAAVRSAIMALIGLLALSKGRKQIASLSLIWAAAIMALWNPMLVMFDRGFQLSFAATLGLILFSGWFSKRLKFLPKSFSIRESAAATLGAELCVVPFLLYWGNTVSPLSPLANILVIGVLPLIMFFSFIGTLIAFVSLTLGQLFALPAYLLISYQLFVVKFLSAFF